MNYLLLLLLFGAVCAESSEGNNASASHQNELEKWSVVMEPYRPLMQLFGPRFIKFLFCMGFKWAENCVAPTMACLGVPNPISCITLILCEGYNTAYCASRYLIAGKNSI